MSILLKSKSPRSTPTKPDLILAASAPPVDNGQAVMWLYRDVESALGVCERTVRRMIRRGDFPEPIPVGYGRTLGWPADVAQVWIERKVAESRTGPPDTCLPAPGVDALKHHVVCVDRCGG